MTHLLLVAGIQMDTDIGNRLYDMLENDTMTDVTIIVQETKIKAHRVVASSRGGLLRKLLEDEEKVLFELKEDISVETFRTVLEYIYTDSCNINDNNLFQVMYAAKVLDLNHLERICGDLVLPKLTVANLGAFTSLAVELGAEEIVKVCVEFFQSYTSEVIKRPEFLDISHDALLKLCSSKGIACSELELFTACVEWAKKECWQRRQQAANPKNIRTALGDILWKIRFPVMPREDFVEKVMPLDILTFEEVGRLFVQWENKKNVSNFKGGVRTGYQGFQSGGTSSSGSAAQDATMSHRHPGIYCDNCLEDIVGIRYKCGNCVDFDFCESCEKDGIHDPTHVFLKIARPARYTRRIGAIYGKTVTCSPGYVATDLCTSATYHDCGDGIFTLLTCCAIKTEIGRVRFASRRSNSDVQECSQHGGGKGEVLRCPSDHIVTSVCSSGRNANCANKYTGMQCCDGVGVSPSEFGCRWIGAGYGRNASCGFNEVITGVCTSARSQDCFGEYTQIHCCPVKP